jgi:2-desacetyl-2-hydroxyethyl bacteriochlorophyllide A dehydrogenase
MKAARYYAVHQPLKVEEVEVPSIGANEVLVKVVASGICHTDLHFLDGTFPAGKSPLVLGHEPAGVVEKVGENVTQWKRGDRVIPFRYFTCGKCYSCLTGNEEVCYDYIGQLGFNWDGGYAEYFKVPERFLVRIPDAVSFREAGSLTCAGHTAYHAVTKRAKVKLGEKVLVNGGGGVGIEVLQFAKAAGAAVFVSDINDKKLEMARQFGADGTFNPRKQDVPAEMKRITKNLGVDVVVDTVGAKDSMEIGLNSLRKLGRIVLLGVGHDPIPNATSAFILANEFEILGSRSSNKQELVETLELVAAGKIKPIVTRTFKIEQITEALELLKKGEIMGRACIEF